jgi:hypothetical protein
MVQRDFELLLQQHLQRLPRPEVLGNKVLDTRLVQLLWTQPFHVTLHILSKLHIQPKTVSLL